MHLDFGVGSGACSSPKFEELSVNKNILGFLPGMSLDASIDFYEPYRSVGKVPAFER